MKYRTCLTMICMFLILLNLVGTVSVDSAQYDKSVSIYFNIDNGKISTKSMEMYYGTAPNLIPTQEGFKGELVADDGSIVKTFTVWDPRIQFGDALTGNPDSPRIQGVVDRQVSADAVVIFPYDNKITGLRLYDSAKGMLLASVDLQPQIDAFFTSYPEDPDNPALSGSKAPVITDRTRAGITDPDAVFFGQLWGMITIGAGAVLILGGAFASVRLLRVLPKNVLIVDDNRDILEVIGSMVRMGGYTTRTATSGEECLKQLEGAVPDLILLDIGMEPMDGWETLRRIKKNPATKGIPVVMLTAQKLTPKDVEDFGICIEDYVVKPVTLRDLDDALKRVFSRQQMIREKIAGAKGTGIDRNELCECARLTRIVDVNKRLYDLLVKTYNLEAGATLPDSEITLAMKNTEQKIRNQELRLAQIHQKLGTSTRG